MKYILDILRKEKGADKSYRQRFSYIPVSDKDTVASALRALNERTPLKDESGSEATPIEWECSCLQKKCGACAMVINGRPRLACDALLSELGEVITVEPLKKFPAIEDLVVDRSIMSENLKTLGAWLENNGAVPDKYRDISYEASLCIQCGLCLEVCPEFYAGGRFFGMASVPITGRLLSCCDADDRKRIAVLYTEHIFEGCGKSLSCKGICPRKLDTEELLVNSNAISIWKRKRK